MTKKDFEKIALGLAMGSIVCDLTNGQTKTLIYEMADILYKQNNRFNSNIFEDYVFCKIETIKATLK